MLYNARNRFITVLLLLTCLLFAQVAVAAYVCPGGSVVAAEASMPCAESMNMSVDEQLPALCHAHCKVNHQKADTYQMPVLASLPYLGADYLAFQILALPAQSPLQSSLLSRTTFPTLAIRHCCFRL